MLLHSQDLTNLFKEMSESNFINEEMSCALFSHVDLKVYLNTEDQLLQELRNYIKQYLNKPFADLTSGIVSSINCELLDISHLLSNTSQSKDRNVAKNCREIARLHNILQKTEENRIKELIASVKVEEKVKYLENKINKNYIKTLPFNRMLFIQQQKQLEAQLIAKKTEIEELLTTILPNVIKKCIQCRSAVVLTGDYETKLARQQYFYKRQKMITDQLLKQRSRWEFLLLLFQVESHYQDDIHKLLKLLNDNFSEVWKEFCLRKDWMKHYQIKSNTKTKELCSEDKIAKDLMMMIEPNMQQSGRVLFQTYDDLKEAAERITDEHLLLHSFISSSYVKQMKQLDLLKQCFNQWNTVVYNSNKENGSKSMMCHLDVANLKKLEANIHAFEKEAKNLIQDFERKKKEIKEDKHKLEERQLFIQFYTAPETFRQTINSLIDRVEGEEKLQILFAE
ncbi:HAUS augmin-like complex subunit 3 [Centruroides sculpturatus]|uniref:HAUS augmin-like complex subunit 3 n=1 Tax=Centruroides sculpturatus TaxID=218467 RepID=UPI000C6CCCF3|nr:HAUS augmin-like complex subunit 3 [Centruroides sculpturatus]